MKNKSIAHIIWSAFLFLTITTLITSCKKNEKETSFSGPENAKLIFAIQGVEELNLENNKQASAYSNNKNSQPEVIQTNLSSKVIMSTSAEESSISGNNLVSNAASGLKNKVAAPQKMKKDVTYRILLYYRDGGAFAKSVLAKAGTPVEIPVMENVPYLWYAYSYNNEDDIPLPNTTNPQIPTPTDKDLLWARSGPSGSVAATMGVNLPITFRHSLTRIHVKVNKKNLYGNITSFNAKFSQNYIHTATFNIKTGTMVGNTQTAVDVGNLVFTQSTTDPDLREAFYYTSNPPAVSSYKVTIDDLKITYVNGVNDILASPSDLKEATLGTYTPLFGKSLIGNINLHYFFGTKRKILHLAYGPAVSQVYSYAGETVGKASYNMFIQPLNFGPEGKVRTVQPHTHVIEYDSYEVAQYLNVSQADKPDIIIVGQYYYFNAADVTALVKFVNDGGVLLLMSDNGTVANQGHRQFLKALLGNTVTLEITANGSGSVYKFDNIINPITVGPFGDVRNGYWGEDASYTMYAGSLPTNEVEIMTTAISPNGVGSLSGATMFRHKSKNFFWIGDAGFLSNELPRGTYNSQIIEPFATNASDYPISKSYGNGYSVSNSIIYANFMAWALMRAEFYGIKTGGLRL